MSDSYERSYYEIALTNSQVLSALAVLLLCLLASFVAGMWVARDASAPAEMTTSTAAPATADDSDAYPFFGGDSARSGDGTEAADEPPRRSVQPVQVAAGTSEQPATEPPAEATPAATPPADDAAQRARERRQAQRDEAARQQAARRAALDDETPTEESPAAGTAADAPTRSAADEDTKISELVFIQVLSSSDQEQAGGVVARLKESGYRAFISSAEVEGRTMYRVRVGPYADRGQADEAADRIKRQFRLETWITASA